MNYSFNDRVVAMADWEEGKLSEDDVVRLFQDLIDDDLVWYMRGDYVEQAAELISAGECTAREFIK